MTGVDGFAALKTAFAVLLITVTGCTTTPAQSPSASKITSTTKVAGAGVLGNQRRPDESCAPEPARTDPGPPLRLVRNAADTDPQNTEVPADPQRIVVLAGDQLDALCALGLESRIVAAALPDGSDNQPSYLGTVVHDLAAAGSRTSPDLSAIVAAHPDLILGSQGLTPKLYSSLAEIAPTVFTAAPGGAWEDNLRTVGSATSRIDATEELIDKFLQHATEAGAAADATHFQVSVVQLTDNALRVYGSSNFAASVLKAVGLDRPASQRFADEPYIEISTDNLGGADFSVADGDIVYVSFASPAAKAHADTVLDSAPWRRLSANRDNRVFVVNNEVWQAGQGLIAARGIIDDLRLVNAPVN
ncbi:MAG: iron-siderophore ABC transporter substrate-binding protein [Mycobacterium sp.]